MRISRQPFSRRDKLRYVMKLCLVSKLNVHIRSIPFPNHVTHHLITRHALTRGGHLNLADFVDVYAYFWKVRKVSDSLEVKTNGRRTKRKMSMSMRFVH